MGDVGTVAGVELGLGYAVAPAVRLEALLTYRPRFTFDGHANFLAPDREQSVSVDLSSLSGILAAYIDLPGLGVRPARPLSPFVGGGLGATRVASGETRMDVPEDEDQRGWYATVRERGWRSSRRRRLGPAAAEKPWRPSPGRPLAENRGTDANHRGALFDGRFEITAHPHRNFSQAVAVGDPVQTFEIGAGLFGVLEPRRHTHESPQPKMGTSLGKFLDGGEVGFSQTALALFLGQFNLEKDLQVTTGVIEASRDFSL